MVDQKTRQRFEKFVVCRDGDKCWSWTGNKNSDGYGRFWFRDRLDNAHRVSYEIHIGPIPNGMHIMHSCDNRECTNPKHLSVGTHQDNIRDRTLKKREVPCNGIKNGRAKLNIRQVVTIKLSDESCAYLGRKYGVSYSQISKVRRGVAWKLQPARRTK